MRAPIRSDILYVAIPMPVRRAEKMTPRMPLESTLFCGKGESDGISMDEWRILITADGRKACNACH